LGTQLRKDLKNLTFHKNKKQCILNENKMKKKISIIDEILNSASSLPVRETSKKTKEKTLRTARTKRTKSGKVKKNLKRRSLGGRLDEL